MAAIKKQNLLFDETFIQEEKEKLSKRKEILKSRYNQ